VVRTAGNDGSKLVIFVLGVAQGPDLSLSFVAGRRALFGIWTTTGAAAAPDGVERRTSRYSREVSRPTAASRRRRLLALALAAVAIGLVVLEPFPKGEVLLSLTDTHGVDTGDLPALALLLVAVGLAI
jgi:hypothetical protein